MSDYLMHHGVLGQKWGVRRFQNADGSLTAAGKQKLAKYKERQLKNTESFYNRNLRSGLYGMEINRQGFKSLDKERNKLIAEADKAKLKSDSEKLKKIRNDIIINENKTKVLAAMKKIEMNQVKNMTFDQMHAEKINLGKEVASSILKSAAISAITLPTLGMVYTTGRDAGAIRSEFRANNFKKPEKKK
jgi:hypothetical protein